MRWTIRSVDEEIIEAVRAVQDRTGRSLGEIVSLAIQQGLPAAVAEFDRQPSIDQMIEEIRRNYDATLALLPRASIPHA